MDSSDSHDAQVQVPGHLPTSGAQPVGVASGADGVEASVVNPDVVKPGVVKPGVFAAGTIIGASYEIIELLGRGAMGIVYRVKHVTLPAEYALKILTDDKQDEVSVIRFQNEAQAIAKLNHPNIVAIYNFGVHEGTMPFYVMDLLEGEDLLDKVVFAGPLTPEEALPLFIEACAGLSYAHRKGILHRDVKPANLLILDKPDVHGARVKVVDFGIVKFAEELKPEVQKLTAMGIVCGSPSYMSPEQAMGQKVDPRSDIYSLGCSLFEALTGKVPFRGRSASDTMMMHASTPSPSLASKNAERTYSDELEIVVAKMMAKEQMYRYQSMDAVAQDLKNILEGKPLAGKPFAQSHFGVAAPAEGAVTLSLGSDSKASIKARYGADEQVDAENLDEDRFFDQRYSNEQEVSGEYESEDDDSEEAEGASSTKVRIALVSLLVVSIVGAAAFFAMKSLGSTSQASINLVSNHKIAKDEMSFLGQELSHVGDSEPNPKVASIKLTDARYFSNLVTIDGKKFVQFDFPVKSSDRPLAWIGITLHSARAAVGAVRIPLPARICLVPSPDTVYKTEFFSKFRPGEISELIINAGYACDELVIAATKTPEIQAVTILDCSTLTPKIIPALNGIRGLNNLNLVRSSISPTVLAKATFLLNLKELALSGAKQITPVLKELKGSRNLELLDVSDSGIGPEDYKLIASMPNLRKLKLGNNTVSTDDLRRLSRLPRLTEIWLDNIHKKDGITAKDIEQFPFLRICVVDRGHFKRKDIAYLRGRRPGLQVQYYSIAPAEESSHDLLLDTMEPL